MRLPGLLRVFRYSDHLGYMNRSVCEASISISSYEGQHVTLSSRDIFRPAVHDDSDKLVSTLSHGWEREIEGGRWHRLMPILHIADHTESH
jgi:hypothetical protein